MADKKVIVVAAGNVAVDGNGAGIKKFMKKTARVDFTNANVVAEVSKVAGCAALAPEALAGAFEGETALAVVDLTAAANFDAAMDAVMEAADRRTLVVLACDGGLYFTGMGVDRKTEGVARQAVAADIVATICFVADLPIPDDATGAILYQILKDPNMKMKEIQKLKDALGRMEAAMQRDNREPWDKHDCA